MPSTGKDYVIQVETAVALTFVEVKDGRALSLDIDAPTTKVPVFNRASSYAFAGQDSETYGFDMLYSPTDPGQVRVRAMGRSKTPVKFRFLPLGGTTNGWEHEVVISRRGQSADPDGGAILQTFQLSGNAPPVAVGTGIDLP